MLKGLVFISLYEELLRYGILHGLGQIPEIKEYLLMAADIL